MNLNIQTVMGRMKEKGYLYASRHILAVMVILFAPFLFPAIGHCSISIMPMESQLQVSRLGARLTNDIEVYNSGDSPIHVTTSVMDWTMTMSGQKKFHKAGTQPLSCATWIQMNPVEFNLQGGKSLRVRYSVSPPADMVQEHHAMIFFTSRAVPKEGDNRFALNVQTRIGCKVLVTPPLDVPLQGKITDLALKTLASPESLPTASGERPVNFQPTDGVTSPQAPLSMLKVTFVNPNPVSVRLNGTVEARNTEGQLVAKGEIMPAKALILVGATRELWAQFDQPLSPDTYQIKAIIDYGGKELISGNLRATVKPPTDSAGIDATQGVVPTNAVTTNGLPSTH